MKGLGALSNDKCIDSGRVSALGLGLLLEGATGHLPRLEVNHHVISRWWQLSEWGKPHLHHACPELSCIVKLTTNIFSNFLGGLGEGILSGHHIIVLDGVLDFGTLSFELGFLIATTIVVVALLLV